MAAVVIVEHRGAWRDEFEVIASELRGLLGAEALRIDHIGSTAVPALAAKDIIDVQVTVRRLDDGVAQRFIAAGFTAPSHVVRQDHVPPGFDGGVDDDWRKLFFLQRPGTRRSNIHVREAGKPNQRYALLVRDYLRADPLAAQAYGELKRRLAAALADPDDYPDVKDPVSDILHLAAERWALATGWDLARVAW